MHRILAIGVTAVLLSGCGISLPSMPASFMNSDDDAAEYSRKPEEKRPAAASRLAGFWDSLSSPFGKKGGKADNVALMAANFRPDQAQKLINAYRAKNGLRPLSLNAKLQSAAQMHAEDLARHDRISHFGSDGSDIEFRARKSGYVFNLVAENVGTGQFSVEEIVKGWRESPSHNENLLLPDAKHMGIALVYKPETEFKTFWALVVGSGQ